MHLNDGELRAYLDHELGTTEGERAERHLSACGRCQARATDLRQQAAQVNGQLAALAPHPRQVFTPMRAARARLTARISEKENTTMLKRIFTRPYRTAWAGLAVILLLTAGLAFSPVRAIANSFLGLFRVQQLSVVQVNPGNLPEQLGSSSQLEYMLSEQVQFEDGGEPVPVASAAEAGSQAGFPIRLPTAVKGSQTLEVQPGGRAIFNVDLARVRALLAEVGRPDIQLPDELDGAQVTVSIPTGVLAQWGECAASPQALRQSGYDPDDQTAARLPDCTTLLQMPSPTIQAPAGLNLAQIGEAFLQVMGMNPEEAAHFAQNVDWTTTLVVPIPRYGTTYRELPVDGVTGTLIEQDLEDHPRQYLLVWVKDGLLYALTGPGNVSTALRIAQSMP